MKIGNQHGGKREGAGRIPKWDPLFKLHVGQDCEELFKREIELAIEQAKNKLFGQETDLKEQWQHTNRIPIEQRSAWLKSEEADRHQFDIEQELGAIHSHEPDTFPKSRLLSLPAKPPRGTRSRIISEIAKKYSLSIKQTDNLWQAYRRFERSL